MNFRGLLCALGSAALMLAAVVAIPAADDAQYVTGGPLAGLKLPPFKRGQWQEVELYPGAVEHYRAYMMKYLPTRSFFDKQSMLRNWVVPDIPGAEGKPIEEFRAPIYSLNQSSTGGPTGQFWDPAPVIRCKPLDPVFKLDLGELDIGLYAVRVIAAVETAKLRQFREPVYVTMRVNDGLAGEVSTYRLRIGYVDDFYSVAEIYFHAPEKRRFNAEVWVDRGSTVDLLVHNITLDDVLAGTTRRAIKQRMTLEDEEPKTPSVASKYLPQARLGRDAAIWRAMPPINAQGNWVDYNLPPAAEAGVGDRTAQEIAAQYGTWQPVKHGIIGPASAAVYTSDPTAQRVFLRNDKLGLEYTVDDLWARRPLPDPYPYKDDGSGLFFPDPGDPGKGRLFSPVANEVGARLRAYPFLITNGATKWRETGDVEFARDAAIALVRYAYQFPAIDTANYFACITMIPGPYDRDLRCRQREEMSRWAAGYDNYLQAIYDYDRLFDYIKGNEALAQSVSRFVPWVKTSEDVVKLIDVYLVQTEAKRILRYHDFTHPTAIATVATALADRSLTDPWMEWLFSRTFVYPLDPAGLQDLMITGCDREGPEYIGSTYYAFGEGASRTAAGLERYLATGGNPRYDLGDTALYPKPLSHCYWRLRSMIGAADFARIGDVGGPDKAPGRLLGGVVGGANSGWRWSHDPKFAWMLKHVRGRTRETDQEWGEIEEAAAQVKRAPWLDLRSRAVDNWFGVLESGLQHDDYRFRRAVYVRAGMGIGHEHQDTLDLQVFAHGLPMTVDGGQRSGYSEPNDRHFARTHNVVEVNGNSHRAYAYVRTISDAEGARYLDVVATPPAGVHVFRRQVALIDVDEGQGSQPLPPEQQRPDVKLSPGVTTPNSYVFDVFRVGGGKVHTYCFHAMVDDDFQWNAENVQSVPHLPDNSQTRNLNSDANYLALFTESAGEKFAGDAPDVLQATWRYMREGKTGTERQMLGPNYDPASPPKFTRLHLFDTSGARALRADVVCLQPAIPYRFTALMAQKRAAQGELESAFPAIIEPFAGQPFIVDQKLLSIPNNDADAERAVAVEVKTQNGHTDICFADGHPDKLRQVGPLQIMGEFAYYSIDPQGLRQATLSGGTLLSAPEVGLKVAYRERTATVTKVDYLKKILWLDQAWPVAARLFEIGTPQHWTSYEPVAIAPEGDGTRVALLHGADYLRSEIGSLDPDKGQVRCRLEFPLGTIAGRTADWTASNDTMTKFWRADHLGGPVFRLTGPVAPEDFAPSNVLRLWEYGVGDTVRQRTFVSLRRIDDNTYELTSDVDVTVTLKGKPLEVSADRMTWKRQGSTPTLRYLEALARANLLAGKPLYLRVVP